MEGREVLLGAIVGLAAQEFIKRMRIKKQPVKIFFTVIPLLGINNSYSQSSI
jgi:hypothetical protein